MLWDHPLWGVELITQQCGGGLLVNDHGRVRAVCWQAATKQTRKATTLEEWYKGLFWALFPHGYNSASYCTVFSPHRLLPYQGELAPCNDKTVNALRSFRRSENNPFCKPSTQTHHETRVSRSDFPQTAQTAPATPGGGYQLLLTAPQFPTLEARAEVTSQHGSSVQ